MSKKLSALMLTIMAVGVAHMVEQLMTSIEEFYMIRDSLGGWYALFPAAYADRASVLLITIVFTSVSMIFYFLMRGGIAPVLLAGMFGLFGITEAHHWIEAIAKRGYDPGVVTSIAYVGVGLMIVIEVVRELKARSSAAVGSPERLVSAV